MTLRRHPLSDASAKSLQQGRRASKTSDMFLSHFIVISLPDLRGPAVTIIKGSTLNHKLIHFQVSRETVQSTHLLMLHFGRTEAKTKG